MNKYTLVALSVSGGLLSGLAWSGWCTGLILLIAFLPFFIIENHIFENHTRYASNAYFIYLLPGMFIFSILSMGWMRVASLTGAIVVIAGLSFLMSFSLWLAHVVRLKNGNIPGIISLFAFWLGYEYLSLNINIVSPWINLGNGLAKDILFIQWYEFTGTAGGTIWILLSNLLLLVLVIKYLQQHKNWRINLFIWILSIAIPAGLSVSRYLTISQNHNNGEEIVIVQPNIDPYTQKFTIPFDFQLKAVTDLAESVVTDNTSWIITPETTVDDPVNLNDLNSNKYVNSIRDLAVKYPAASIVTGMVTYKNYPPSVEPPTISARIIDVSNSYYDHFNSALKIDTSKIIEFYHKSKLVPGIEMQFSNGPGRFISKILPSLGGTKWGYGIQSERICFSMKKTSEKAAPIICYESVFGEYVTDYVQNGANELFIITNDGWWKNTNGYKQHLAYASLRAIETRRQVARCGNTGVSCIIDIRGRRTTETRWWTKIAIKGEIFPETHITTYVRYGDYLLRFGAILSIMIILVTFIAIPLRKKIKTI